MGNTVRASLDPRFVGGFNRGVTVGCSAGGVDSVEFVHVKGMTHLLAEKAFVCEVPTVEETILVRLVRIDNSHRGLGERCNGVGRIASRPRFGRRVGSALSERRQCRIRRRRDSVAVVSAFLSVSAPFVFVGFAFPFSLVFALAFGCSIESVATPRGGFPWHISILIQEILLESGKSTLVKGSVGAPGGNIRVKLGPGLNRGQKVVNACEFRDVVTTRGEKFVVLSHRTAEVAEVGE